MEKTRIVTTSWDDGDCADLKVAELLNCRGVRGTFYVPINYRKRALDHNQLRSLASGDFEIGAHGFSHKLLWHLSPQGLAKEVRPCRPILEDIIGREVRMFSYPGGRYDASVVRALQEAGYWGGRTVCMLATRPTANPFEMPTTLQMFPHPWFTYLKNVARAHSLESLQMFLVQRRRLQSCLALAKALFDLVLENGGIWHLYGHSWEIDNFGLWADLGEILNYVGGREGVSYVSNCALVSSLENGQVERAGDQVVVPTEAIKNRYPF
jgi:peptidoglycan/xylan/chitin deacetylase (PgdA/CDA1 family)